MAAMGTSYICGGFSGEGNVSIVPTRASSGSKVQGWKKLLSWRLEPEVLWCRPGSRKARQLSTLHLRVTASTKDHQNVDLPPVLSKRKKKPSLLPKRTKKKLPAVWEDPSLVPPGNGLLVKDLIPVAYDVMQAKAIVTKGVRLLLKELPLKTCRYCPDVHIGLDGHLLRTCLGTKSTSRRSLHDWGEGTIDDVLVPIEAYHLEDRMARPITHEQRFNIERISAIEELCIQAGVDVPEYPTRRYTEPAQNFNTKKRQDSSLRVGGEFTFYTSDGSYQLEPSKKERLVRRRIRADDFVDYQVDDSKEREISDDELNGYYNGGTDRLQDHTSSSTREEFIEPLVELNREDDLEAIAQKTVEAWERMRDGAKRLMTKYRVVTCGYCPEIHVGQRGHRARNCGAFKHQWRDGKHGWQDASVDDLIAPRYVWHVRDRFGRPLENELRRYYGQAPAVVELCVQAGALVPESYKALMRLDIAIPTLDESVNVI